MSYLNSDDGSNLFIGNSMVVDNDGSHSPQEVHGSIALKAGKHSITVNYFQQSGSADLQVSYSSAGFAKMIIPDAQLYRDSGTSTDVNTVNTNINGTFLSQNIPCYHSFSGYLPKCLFVDIKGCFLGCFI